MFREGLLWKENKIFVPESIRVTILGPQDAQSSAMHVLVARPRRKLEEVREFMCNLYPEKEY